MLSKLLILVIQLKKSFKIFKSFKKVYKIDQKIPDHYKYIATKEFNELTADNFLQD